MSIIEKVKHYKNADLLAIWRALGTQQWCAVDMYDECTSMDTWASMIKIELETRGIPH